MAQFIQAKIHIKGTRPFLWNRFSEDSIPLERVEKKGVPGNNPEEWKKSVLMQENGQLYVEPSYFFGCIRDAAIHTKMGRGSIQKQVASTLQITDEIILVKDRLVPLNQEISRDPNQPVYLDVRSVRNPSTRGRNIRYRVAASKGWEMEFNIFWDLSIVETRQMEAVLNDAGQLVGIGDARSIGFGRFDVLKFQFKKAKRKIA